MRVEHRAHPCDDLGRGGLAHEQARHLDGEQDRDHHQQHTDREAADRVPAGLVEHARERDADQREAEPDRARRCLRARRPRARGSSCGARTGGSTCPRRSARLSRSAVRSENDSSTTRDEEHGDRDPRILELVRIDQLLDALEDREQAADAEQHERDHERPEVAQRAVAERVHLVGGTARPRAAEHQQALVAGVGERVDRLGEHRRRAGERERDELAQRDAEVREERGDDRPPRAVVHASAPSRSSARHPTMPPCVIASTSSARSSSASVISLRATHDLADRLARARRLLDHVGRGLVADVRRERGADRRRRLGVLLQPVDVGLDAGDALVGEHRARTGEQARSTRAGSARSPARTR